MKKPFNFSIHWIRIIPINESFILNSDSVIYKQRWRILVASCKMTTLAPKLVF